jgi:long-chain acyl-CoA synthetase
VARDTLIDFFRDLERARGDFLVYDNGFRSRTHTYEQVARAAREFASNLRALGLRKGDKVVFWSENRPEWIVAFWGCLLRGVVVVPVDYRASPDFLARVSRIVSARLVLIGQDVPPLTRAPDTPVWRLHELGWPERSPASTGSDLPDVPLIADDVVEIIFTSGATADPKGVVITHRNILANIVPVEREVLKYRRWSRPFAPIRFLNLLPLSHMFGQAMATFVPPMLPGVVVFMRGYNPLEITAQIANRRISVLVSVPKILDVLREHVLRAAKGPSIPGPKQHFLRRWWRYRSVHRLLGWKFWAFVVGAAPLDSELEATWSELGYVVVQGYGLTETAPIVSLNHPFRTRKGSVGKAMAGVEVRIAPDGEILVRGDNVTRGYFNAAEETARAFEDGWFHTGDIGEIADDGQLYIRGRKKEMIVTPEGLNVFPEDVERVLAQVPGVRDAAVVGARLGTEERVHAVLALDESAEIESIVRQANAELEDHQKIRRALVWPERELPRTEGTRKLKRAVIRDWVAGGATERPPTPGADPLVSLLAKYAGRSGLRTDTTLEELGLSSLERVELMVALEDAFQRPIDESRFAAARDIGELRTLVEETPAGAAAPASEPVEFPAWNRSWLPRAIRRVSLPTWILPLSRVFAWMRVEGRGHLDALGGPVIFAANHQSHMDTPVIMAALPPRLRYRVAPAMAKEFFKAHFFPAEHGRLAWFTSSLNYYLAALFFNAFPLPQREAGARQTLRYIGQVIEDGFSVLIFPEGKRTEGGEIAPFRPGIGMIASRLNVPVVPVRVEGVDRVLHQKSRMAKPGRVRVAFGAPLHLKGTDYPALAREVENAVRRL